MHTHIHTYTHTHTHLVLWGYNTLELVDLEVNPLCENTFPGVSGMRHKLKV